MKIAIVLPVINISGGVKISLTYALELNRLGHDVDVLVLSDRQYDGWMGPLPLKIHYARDYKSLAKRFFTLRFDAMICTFWMTVYAVRTGFIRTRKVFYLVQGDEPNFYKNDTREASAALMTYHGTEHKIVISKFLSDVLRSYGPTGDIVEITNGISKVDHPVEPLINKGKNIRILVEGKLGDPLKRVDETLEMLSRIEGIDIIAVTPSYDEPSRNIANILLRAVPAHRMTSVYASADIIVKFSKTEGFGLPVLEAMACGVVPIVTAFGGMQEYLDDGRNGVVLKNLNLDELIEAINYIADNLYDMQKACLKTSEKYIWKDQFSQLANAIAELPENGVGVSDETVVYGLPYGDDFYAQQTTLQYMAGMIPLTRRIEGTLKNRANRLNKQVGMNFGPHVEIIELENIQELPEGGSWAAFSFDTDKLGHFSPIEAEVEVEVLADHGLYILPKEHGFNKINISAHYDYSIRINGQTIAGRRIVSSLSSGDIVELDFSSETIFVGLTAE